MSWPYFLLAIVNVVSTNRIACQPPVPGQENPKADLALPVSVFFLKNIQQLSPLQTSPSNWGDKGQVPF